MGGWWWNAERLSSFGDWLSDSDAISSPLPHISVLIVSTASSLLYALICPCNACLCHAVILSKYPFSSLPFPSTDDPLLLPFFTLSPLPSSLLLFVSLRPSFVPPLYLIPPPLFCRPFFICSCQPVSLSQSIGSIDFVLLFIYSSLSIDIQILRFPFRMPNSIQFPLLLLLSLVPVILCQESIVPAVRVVRLQIDYENADVSSLQKINK